MNCNQCRHKRDAEEEVKDCIYCTWHHDWILKKWINGKEGCPGFFKLEVD